jgi:hypothetical protein
MGAAHFCANFFPDTFIGYQSFILKFLRTFCARAQFLPALSRPEHFGSLSHASGK